MAMKMEIVEISSDEEDVQIPPPPSQSHFAKFEDFTPDDAAPFEDEFARLAASQEWVPGSQEYKKERTIAMRAEIKSHFFSQEPLAPITEEDELRGYQSLCEEVDLPPYDTTEECKRELKKTLVNIVDLIDTRRTNRKVKVWQDFQAFREYTLQDGHTISREEASKDGGYLESLLQHLGGGRRRRRRSGRGVGNLERGNVSAGIVKREQLPEGGNASAIVGKSQQSPQGGRVSGRVVKRKRDRKRGKASGPMVKREQRLDGGETSEHMVKRERPSEAGGRLQTLVKIEQE
ncbi:hypothetical protein ISF_01321 [Cordyceps fumosorosea ARSEF 2679]|uniref:Uncharacterized protein n=1 Tax=Cordyceps fumosorosea (strain ARSEF 2679) TaxID=1081104 RepID=A0A168D777_CORFA|nr:hypothetical protein ISF_01321 [Cordyceps fumosorosea ARSEF 2679]OAA72248.1 hypothetical protein ISF_01321 [Cordyceps fumosorosea ARSEF 2679]